MSNPNIASRFDDIYNSTNKDVLAYITAKCRYTADISDVFQDTYMELYKILIKQGVDYVTHGKALVFRIAKRKIARYYSLLERLRMFISIAVVRDDYELDLPDLESGDFLTEDFAVNQTVLVTAKEYIQSKPEDIQKVFYLMYDVDLTIAEIALALNISESNVKNKLYRTLKELRSILK